MKMLRVQHSRMLTETKDVPDGELFFVWDTAPVSSFIVTTEEKKVWALATRIKGQFYTSDWWEEGEKDWKQCMDSAMKQMVLLIKTGWSIAGETTDEFGYPEKLFRCVYCHTESTEPKGICFCLRLNGILAK